MLSSSLLKPKFAQESLKAILDNYDKDAFLTMIQTEADYWTPDTGIDSIKRDKMLCLIYRKMVAKLAPQIVSLSKDINLPYPVCNFVFYELGVKIPNQFLAAFTWQLALDAYFGAAYAPSRYRDLFDPGAADILRAILQEKVSWKDLAVLILAGKWQYTSMIGATSPEEVLGVWGDQIPAWWRKASPEDREQLCKNLSDAGDQAPRWYEVFDQAAAPGEAHAL